MHVLPCPVYAKSSVLTGSVGENLKSIVIGYTQTWFNTSEFVGVFFQISDFEKMCLYTDVNCKRG